MIRLKVREVAERKGVDQGTLARLAHIDRRTIKRIYEEPTTDITVMLLDRLAMALNVDASLLIESVPPETP